MSLDHPLWKRSIFQRHAEFENPNQSLGYGFHGAFGYRPIFLQVNTRAYVFFDKLILPGNDKK
jgi:hypothetical protein